MDSGNSSSMQSSSGGDEEYDSRPESLPAFLNTSGHFNPLSNPHPSLVSHHQDHPPTFFDPSSNYLNPFSQSQPNNSLLNLDGGVRPRGLRSEPNCTDLGNLPGSSSSSQSMLGAQGLNQGSFPSSSSMQSRPAHDNGARSLAQSDQTSVVKNPKKRTRASRRAPTTVLTTDTTNFRAMVQEFTGIPAPPFSGSSYSRRLDLFGSGSGMRSSHLEPLGSLYPLRPSAKRVQPTPFVSSSSPSLLNNPLVDAANITNTTSNSTIPTSIAATTNAFNPTSSNYQLPSDLSLLKQPQNMLNLQNQSPVLSFQSFLQPPTLHPSLNLPGFGVKSQGSSAMPSLDELGMSHGHVNANLGGLQSHVTPDGPRLRSDSNWRDGVGLNDGNQDHLRPLDGNYGHDHQNSQRVNNSCKLNFSASSSDFHHDKGLDNVSSRAEGTVDSWICPAE
ncbi:uncharacterized protein LOC110416658 [Herrania umbratica]|uniref:Uncharacterized protein LOC110416658 n=1 Tax=Herrania umbratica TaxID=108875 RepID=A0A6J1ABM3_9ROSI|nr:uncharacterized protein LOC110416658 [Herrania umbratica]